jgi:hypothetical protein
MRVKESSARFVRLQEEQIKFNHLLCMLVWAKGRTGRPSDEIVHSVLRSGKDGIEWLFYQ